MLRMDKLPVPLGHMCCLTRVSEAVVPAGRRSPRNRSLGGRAAQPAIAPSHLCIYSRKTTDVDPASAKTASNEPERAAARLVDASE